MFTVINGAIFSYTGTHLFGIDTQNNNEHEIRLFPYADTTSANGVYILAVCFLGESASNLTYPVDPGNCEYDAFKVGPPDPTPPTCTASVTTSGGQQMISITVQDPESGIETIVPTSVNATAVLPTWSVGTPDSLVVTGTRTDTSQPGSITLVVTNVAGLRLDLHRQRTRDGQSEPAHLRADGDGHGTSASPFRSRCRTRRAASRASPTPRATRAFSLYLTRAGTTTAFVVDATKTIETKGSFLALSVTNGAGLVTVCDPIIPASKARHTRHLRSARSSLRTRTA